MLDAKLLSASIASREAYEKIKGHITDKDMTPPVAFWWKLLEEWYARDKKAAMADRSLLVAQADGRLSGSKHKDTILNTVRDLPEVVSPNMVANIALELRRYNVGMELAGALAARDDKKSRSLYESYGELLQATSLDEQAQWEDALDWNELDAVVGTDKRIPVAPRRLNERISGGALPGHHIVVFGRPEVGKSTFAINMAAGFLATGQRVLYIGNEDNINVLKARMRNRLANMTPDEVERRKGEANTIAAQKAGDRLMMRHIHRGKTDDLDPAIESFEPTVLIVDQLRHLRAKGDTRAERLENAAQDVRAVAARYGLVSVSITQAHPGEEHNKPPKVYLDMDDVESSRTGIPGTADLMIGIGADNDMLLRNQRMINLPKNKLSSADNAKEAFLVEVDKARARYT